LAVKVKENSTPKLTDSGNSDVKSEQSPEVSGRPSPKAGWLPATLRALRHRNFQLFFSGQLISLIGTWMQTIAESWLVYRKTGSPCCWGPQDSQASFRCFW
jgi:hypothetical protein